MSRKKYVIICNNTENNRVTLYKITGDCYSIFYSLNQAKVIKNNLALVHPEFVYSIIELDLLKSLNQLDFNIFNTYYIGGDK